MAYFNLMLEASSNVPFYNMPLINHASTFDGRLDEDCRQYIMVHIVQNIGKFII